MLPPASTVEAAVRWLGLLRAAPFSRASDIIRSDPSYIDLTSTQYSAGLDWLRAVGVVADTETGLRLIPSFQGISPHHLHRLFFERALEIETPPWLPDADLLIQSPEDLPSDGALLAATLGLSDVVAHASVRQVQAKIDLARRAQIGMAGELALLGYLEKTYPGSCIHVALASDGFGYDIAFIKDGIEWHLETKATTRRGRYTIFLSRHEHDVSLLDGYWRLVLVTLDSALSLQSFFTVKRGSLHSRSPRDSSVETRWQAAAYDLNPGDLLDGLDFSNS